MKSFKNIRNGGIALGIALLCLLQGVTALSEVEYDIHAQVESKRKDNQLTLLFREIPSERSYFIIEEKAAIGKINVLSVFTIPWGKEKRYRVLAEYVLFGDTGESVLKTGHSIGLSRRKERIEREIKDTAPVEKIVYRKQIASDRDERLMVLIPGDRFVYGSNEGDRDEYPEQVLSLDDYYIDKYEVSNRNYLKFVEATNARPPRSWVDGAFGEKEGDLPVMVSYYEAEAYAKWAGKRLPTEEEWEKAARGTGLKVDKKPDETWSTVRIPRLYPWGTKFNPDRANSREFWENPRAGKEIKGKYGTGLLPVNSFEGAGDSPYGVVNMAGNAAEWTASWYRAYKGNSYLNKKFGTQYKVVRGGSFNSTRQRIRVTSREIGGVPNLYRDNLSGFRCVKGPSLLDRCADCE
jgi:formylglycine-generating enzyme required for sulfatase activity